MRFGLILLVLLPILLSLVQAAPPAAAKTATPTGTSPKKGKQLVYYVPGQSRAEAEINNLQHDEQEDEEEEEADDEVDDEDADDDVDDGDDAFDIPPFDKVFPNPDGRPVGPNSYDAFMKHKPSTSGPASHGQAGPRVAGQAGPGGAGHAGPGGRRRVDGPYLRTDIQDVPDYDDGNLGLTPPFPGARLLQIIPADDPNDSNEEPETENIYPKRDGRQSYVGRVPTNRYRPVQVAPVSRPVVVGNRRNYNYNYVPYRRPVSGLMYAGNNNRRQIIGGYPNQYRGVQQPSRPVIYSPIRRNPGMVPVQNNYRPQIVRGPYAPVSPYGVPQVRAGTGRGYNSWTWTPQRDTYNPGYVVNPTEMLSRRQFRYHPSQRVPSQRIPLYDGVWGNPRQHHGTYWSSQL